MDGTPAWRSWSLHEKTRLVHQRRRPGFLGVHHLACRPVRSGGMGAFCAFASVTGWISQEARDAMRPLCRGIVNSRSSVAKFTFSNIKFDAVDGAHSAASKCHRVVALKQTTLRGAVHGRC